MTNLDDKTTPAAKAVVSSTPETDRRRQESRLTRALPMLTVAAVFVVVAGLRAVGSILLPLLLAVFLAVLSLPVLHALLRRGVRNGIAVLATVTVDAALLSAVGFLVSGAVSELVQAVPGYQALLVERIRDGVTALQARGVEVSEWVSPDQLDLTSLFDFAGGILGGTVRGVASAFSFLLMMLVALVFVLAEAAGFPEKLKRAFGGRREVLENVQTVTENIQRYLGIKTLVSAATGILVLAWTAALDVEFAVVWGVLAFFLNYIPAIGSIIAAVPAVLLTLAQFGLGRALLVAVGYLAVNLLLGNFIEPLLMGRQFGLSPLAVLLSLVFWGWVWGPVGMILSVPLSMIIKITLDATGTFQWLSVLLGPTVRADSSQPLTSRP